MARARTVWGCRSCGAVAPRWYGRCPECSEYGTFVEGVDSERLEPGAGNAARPLPLIELVEAPDDRMSSAVPEFDRVLGGGFVTGSLVLLGGEPGIGKSTILLQVAASVARSGGRVLYACGEESCAQVSMRARRIGSTAAGVDLVAETDVEALAELVRAEPPGLLIVDSIQTAFDPQAPGTPGSVGQVRSATSRLARVAKDLGVTTVLVGHVTKDGVIAGPRVLEHMVDAVLYFEGAREHAFRLVRAVKNRFGPVSEIGIFEMTERGLIAVSDPAALLLGERRHAVAGSVVMAAMEGSRPLLVEIQALVTPTCLQTPRRLATGIDAGRLLQVVAVLERRGGLSLSGHDVYVSVAGGVRVTEPAVDVPLAIALASARRDRPVPLDIAAFGEVALTGLVRPVPHADARMREAARQGLTTIIAPASSGPPDGVRHFAPNSMTELAALAW